ncbi:MAG: DUF6125 family protein [Syntrophobacteraceae bacterium]|jgi:hypothetical protein|nr:DUF6125 family protein [Syntrophobacteraceae bacterium]
MTSNAQAPEDLSHEETARLIVDFLHRTMMHHAMWFAEVQHQLGREKAWEVLRTAYDRSYGIQMKRLARTLGFEMRDDIPQPLLDLAPDALKALKEAVAINWLANDGVWFQAVEFSRGMFDAKRCNDSCWVKFSPFEAWSIRRFLNLPADPGLDGLKQALRFRLYATINVQSITDETPNSFVFRMNECRVQSARKQKGLEDYPCKSGGVVEYTTFAELIDPRIRTECVGCPPDAHPDDWYCAWRFSIAD